MKTGFLANATSMRGKYLTRPLLKSYSIRMNIGYRARVQSLHAAQLELTACPTNPQNVYRLNMRGGKFSDFVSCAIYSEV